MDEIRTKQLAESLLKKLSSQIQPWIDETWPNAVGEQLPVEAADAILNGILNFAGINLAVLFCSTIKATNIEYGSEDFNNWKEDAIRGQGQLLTKVFLQNIIKGFSGDNDDTTTLTA